MAKLLAWDQFMNMEFLFIIISKGQGKGSDYIEWLPQTLFGETTVSLTPNTQACQYALMLQP